MKPETQKLIIYSIAISLIVISFFIPPTGVIDTSVLLGTGLLIGSYELLFGTSIKSISIDKTGLHIETHKKED